MAVTLLRTSSQYIERDEAVVAGYPATFACWFYVNDNSATSALISISDKDVDSLFLTMYLSGSGSLMRAYAKNFAGGIASTTTTYSTGQWHHGCAVFAGTYSRAAYLDGGGKGTNASTVLTPSGVDRTSIGRIGDSTPSAYADCSIAEVAVWSTDLTDDEVASLASGFSPLFVRPDKLAFYQPLLEADIYQDGVNRFAMTPYNSPTHTDHPKNIIYPAGIWQGIYDYSPPPPGSQGYSGRGVARGILRGVYR